MNEDNIRVKIIEKRGCTICILDLEKNHPINFSKMFETKLYLDVASDLAVY
jgi:hypothetical protein